MEKHPYTKSVILTNMATSQAPANFVSKIKKKMSAENIGIRQLAIRLGVSHPTVTELVTYGKKPSFDTTLALAHWLGEPPVQTLREAGLLPPEPEANELVEAIEEVMAEMPQDDQEEILSFARMKKNLRDQRKNK